MCEILGENHLDKYKIRGIAWAGVPFRPGGHADSVREGLALEHLGTTLREAPVRLPQTEREYPKSWLAIPNCFHQIWQNLV